MLKFLIARFIHRGGQRRRKDAKGILFFCAFAPPLRLCVKQKRS